MTKILVDKLVLEQVLEALKCVDLQSLVPDYGSGHYSVARADGPQVKSAITVMEAALAKQEVVVAWDKWQAQKRGCSVCGIGADGAAYGYVCPRSDCPTRVICGGAV